ncbi:hypothetical protein AK830_g9361 [Neonectria ditissima]|uniref:Uncharacterized protein n=1 Tax=Neonectria ditissima TaxID=78410 RepID=A0A0P7B5U7_9HYPO|nr:hypothetical protein AK830_g9361 [Neonectria ditissima]
MVNAPYLIRPSRTNTLQRDDEKYPIAVNPGNAPEVVNTTPQPDLEGHGKVVVETPAGLIPAFDSTHKEVAIKDAEGDMRGGEASLDQTTKARTCCGMKRRTFFIALAVLAAVLVAVVVGGVVGGLRAGSDSGTDSSTSGSVPRKTGPIDADERCMAAALVTDDDDQVTYVFYNDLNTTDILYRRIHDDQGGSGYTLGLSIEPNWGAPLAAGAGLSSSVITNRLYYVTTTDNETQIAEAVLNCGNINNDNGSVDNDDDDDDDDGDDDDDDDDDNGDNNSVQTGLCSVTSNSIISSNVSNAVHPDTKLAALRLSNDSMRVYFQAAGGNIWVLHNDDGDWSASNLMGDVDTGSSIAVSGVNATPLHVFYVSESTERLRYFAYSDSLGTEDSEPVDESSGSGWSASAAFASVYVPQSESYRIYYTNPSTGTIVSYVQNTTSAWRVNSDDSWGEPDSSIAAVSWSNQVRLVYFQNSTLVMSSQDAASWDEPEEVGGEA